MLVSKGIGIDLGTTNSAVAVMNATDSDVALYTDKQGRQTLPSCVWRKHSGGPLVIGHEAYARRHGRPEPITSIKRLMGTTILTALGSSTDIPDDIPSRVQEKLSSSLTTRCEEYLQRDDFTNQHKQSSANTPLLFLPEEISACLVDRLRQQIEFSLTNDAVTGEQPLADRGIITIPAYFDMAQIEATRQAGHLAGLEVIDLLHEPTAAAVYFSWRHKIPDGVFLVYDLGGGTFDVSILRRTRGEFEVLGISGDNFLGGDDFDRLLAQWLLERLVDDDYELELDVENDPEDLIRFRRLRALGETAKKELSHHQAFVLRDQASLQDQNGDQVFIEIELQREHFEMAIRKTVQRTIPRVWEALARAYRQSGITLADVDHVLLVGGSTNIPLVQQVVKSQLCQTSDASSHQANLREFILSDVSDEFQQTVQQLLEKDETAKCEQPDLDSPGTCVAMGAAIRAAAAGTVLYDDEKRVRVHFRNQGSTSADACDVAGFAQDANTQQPLSEVTIRLADHHGVVKDQTKTETDGRFRFRGLPLQSDGVTAFGLTFVNDAGDTLAELCRRVEQTETQRDLGSVLSTAVLSKPISLEMMDQGRLLRGILMDEGSSLPSDGQFRFFLRDQSGRIRFPLYHGNRPIREVFAELDSSFEPGTPVDVTVHCDEQMYVRLHAAIANSSFELDVGPPPPPSPPTEDELAELLRQFQDRLSTVAPDEKASFEQRLAALLEDLKQAVATGDDAKAISRFADAEALVKSLDLHIPKLKPPWREVDRVCGQLSQMTAMAEMIDASFDAGTARQRLSQFRREAQTALSAEDQQLYTEAIEKLKSFGEGLGKQLSDTVHGDEVDELPDDQRALMGIAELQRTLELVQHLAIRAGRFDLLSRIQQVQQETQSKSSEIQSRPREVVRWCQQQRNELKRVAQELGASSKQPTLDNDGLLDISATAGSRIGFSGGIKGRKV